MIPQLIANGLIAGSIYTLLAVGFALIYNTTRFFHFAHGAVYTAAAYCTYVFHILLGLNLLASAAASILSAASIGLAIELSVYKPLRARKASPLVLLIASMGVFIVIQNFIALLFGNDPRMLKPGAVRQAFEVLDARITALQATMLMVSVTLVLLLHLFIKRTRLGKAARAIADNPSLAKTVGVDLDRTIAASFIIGSGLAAVAALLISLDIDMRPSMGLNALLMGVVAVIVGGVGSFIGPVFGGFALGLAQHLAIWQISAEWQNAIAFGILVLFLVFKPSGLFGEKLAAVEV